jgi:trimeric autotransporter adhesin
VSIVSVRLTSKNQRKTRMRIRCEPLAARVHRCWRGFRALAAVAAILACGGSTDSVSPGGGGGGAGGVQIAITPSGPSITVGAQVTLQAEVRGANGQVIPGATIFWSSADTNIVTVSQAGVVTGKSIGNTQVAASSSGASTVTTVTVVQVPVASVAVLPSAATLVIGGTVTLQAVAYDAGANALSGRPVVWASSASQVATVDGSGKVTAVSAGTATVTGTIEGKTASSAITVTVIPVAAVAVTPGSANIDVGASKAFNAVVTDASGNTLTSRPITWASANKSIATVSTAGLVTGVGAGTTNITATAENKTGTAQVVVTATTPPPPIPVASVAVNPGTASLNIGGTVTLSATPRDANGAALSGRSVTWSTSDGNIATVSTTGVVTAKAPGSATITATSEGQHGDATITVQPPAPAAVASVTITPPPTGASVQVGQTITLTATARDAAGNPLSGRTISWKASDSTIATVSAGVVTGVSSGTVAITATCEGQNASVAVTVNPEPVAFVLVSATSTSIQVGATTTVTAVTEGAAHDTLRGRTVTWSSGSLSVATVDATSGVVTAVAPGSASITGTSEGVTGAITITVVQIPVATVTISPSNPSVVERQTTPLTATTKDANGNTLSGRTVTWSVTPTSVATINASTGVVTGVSAGTATVTATSEAKSGTATLTVTAAPVATVTVVPPSAPLIVGQTLTLTDTLKDATGFVLTGRVVTWTSSSPSKATVNSSTGLVTGVDSGSTIITATSETKTGTATVVVHLVPVDSVIVTATATTIAVSHTTTVTAVAKDANGATLSGRAVSWSSSNTAVATVAPNGTSSGTVTGVAHGTANIIATIDGKTGSTTITVTP